ncbi:pyridoxamine 5'-phosphate oxidase family protein [Sphingomonas tabacisoli]|uniref:Pyridoxamine 5'-phosphate oxidase family protein n=1 Tax=Sphingomonas tabacisoli TaxID=2249466 RepID=A0ABW4I5U0_9SPHN
MANEAEITEKFWKALKSDRTVMLGLHGAMQDRSQPMTAQTLDGQSYVWFFTTKDNHLVQDMRTDDRAMMVFASKGHDVFATIDGRLEEDNDRERIDQLWNPFVAAWFEGGKDDPNLQLIRFDPTAGQVWLNEHSAFAGLKLLLGRDPKQDYKDKVAEVAF